MIPTQTPISIS